MILAAFPNCKISEYNFMAITPSTKATVEGETYGWEQSFLHTAPTADPGAWHNYPNHHRASLQHSATRPEDTTVHEYMDSRGTSR